MRSWVRSSLRLSLVVGPTARNPIPNRLVLSPIRRLAVQALRSSLARRPALWSRVQQAEIDVQQQLFLAIAASMSSGGRLKRQSDNPPPFLPDLLDNGYCAWYPAKLRIAVDRTLAVGIPGTGPGRSDHRGSDRDCFIGRGLGEWRPRDYPASRGPRFGGISGSLWSLLGRKTRDGPSLAVSEFPSCGQGFPPWRLLCHCHSRCFSLRRPALQASLRSAARRPGLAHRLAVIGVDDGQSVAVSITDLSVECGRLIERP